MDDDQNDEEMAVTGRHGEPRKDQQSTRQELGDGTASQHDGQGDLSDAAHDNLSDADLGGGRV